jgi:putative YpdA family bacillithiol system oxidoreductase
VNTERPEQHDHDVLDVIIIGGGPIGIACSLECSKHGFSHLVLEKGALTNSLYNYPLNMTFFSTAEKLEVGGIPFISNRPKPNRDEALEYYRRVADSASVPIRLYERVSEVRPENARFTVLTNRGSYRSRKVIVATGFYDLPKILDVPGEDLPKVSHYYKEAHPFSMQDVAVIGASNSAVDAALEIWRKGGRVTMIVRGPSIGERVKYWVRPDIDNRIAEGSIKAYFNARVTEILPNTIRFESPDGMKEIPNDQVLALTGYRPDFSFLTSMGITLSDDDRQIPQHDPETMETNVPGIYLAGVICGGNETHKWFIENSRVHAEIIVNHIALGQ